MPIVAVNVWVATLFLVVRSDFLKSVKKVALGGIVVGLSMIIMLLTAVFPMAEFALPTIAGALMIVLVVEMGMRPSIVAYLAVAILSFFITPIKDSAVFYTVLLGWYPIIKSKLESIKNPITEWVLKMLIFNVATLAGVMASVYIFGINEYAEMLSLAIYLVVAVFIFVNVVFVVYDIALTRCATVYIKWFKPKYINKIFKDRY